MILPRVSALLLLAVAPAAGEQVAIVVSQRASEIERTAATELASHLAAIYPADRFVVDSAAGTRRAIRLGTPSTSPEIAWGISKEQLAVPESFVITQQGVIAGADPQGVLFGVYALLEKLGWGFYLSYEAAPPPRRDPISFDSWKLSDAPVFRDRLVFDWHNFLSSASTWEPEDWERWIRGAVRMRFNTVMVHAYGNNPMFTFRHNGEVKPVGYLATTQQGRDWGTQHVNDVQRLWGGEVFNGPVFGASAALVHESERTPATQNLMRGAFTFARSYGMHVTFALDVDTESANPQNIVMTLPESARFTSGKFQLANPDTSAGYAYWKAQVAQLLTTYPQIDRLVVWFRADKTPWRSVTLEEFPAAWQAQFATMLRARPELAKDPNAPSMFALARVTAAFSRALLDLGKRDVELGVGTWRPGHLPAADAFFAPEVKLYWLDYAITFDKPETQAALRAIPRGRAMLPIVWAHHDDRTFMGRPYTPFSRFASLVDGVGTGFGIIHWTTRPLDLYFKSLAEQVWRETRDRPLEDTTREMAMRSFGTAAGGEYLYKWATEGRMFGRETGDRFIDLRLSDAPEVMARCSERIALLDKIDESGLSTANIERLRYYRDFEEFTAQFFRVHTAFERAQDFLKKGQIAEGRAALIGVDPAQVIRQYVKASTRGTISRGEQALIALLNLKWLPYVLSVRQALGMEPARFSFQVTQHEPLAQGAGHNTFFVDDQHAMWKVLGEKETGAPVDVEGGIRITAPLTLKLGAIMGDRLPAGRYRVDLTFQGGPAKSEVIEATNGVVEIALRPSAGPLVLKSAVIATVP